MPCTTEHQLSGSTTAYIWSELLRLPYGFKPPLTRWRCRLRPEERGKRYGGGKKGSSTPDADDEAGRGSQQGSGDTRQAEEERGGDDEGRGRIVGPETPRGVEVLGEAQRSLVAIHGPHVFGYLHDGMKLHLDPRAR